MAKRREAQKNVVKMRQITQKKEKKTASGARGHTNTNTVPMTVPRPTVRVAWYRT